MAEPADMASDTSGMTPELRAYYGDRRLMIRNVIAMGLCNLGWHVVWMIVMPLMTLRMLDIGIRENTQATIVSVNAYLVSFLVMLFSWMSDHTVSRLGRRKPYLFVSAPFIIVPMMAFPFVARPGMFWAVVGLQIVTMLAMDMKASTFPLLNIDCVPRHLLARANSVFSIAAGVVGFVAMRYTGKAIAIAEWFPYVAGGVLMIFTTFIAFWIKEPPIFHPATEAFRPWSTFKVAARDKRIFILMAGVAMVSGYFWAQGAWMWFWAKEALHLERSEIFKALSWGGLVNIVLAYPVGWMIDRWGSLRVTTVYFLGAVGCFIMSMTIHDTSGFVIWGLGAAIFSPLYGAADIAVYRNADPKEVGSITSTNSCLRNGWNATQTLVGGWVIFWCGHNFRIGFIMGLCYSVIGIGLFYLYFWLMNRKPAPALAMEEKNDSEP